MMSDVPKVHTAESLVSLSDDEIAYRANRGKWILTEALFHLNGYKPPGYESVLHLQDHFWPAYHQAVDAIQMGKIGRKIEQAGERVFIDSPANWLAWADNLGPGHIDVDERVRRALSETDHTHSGMVGRPSPKHLYIEEMKRRATESKLRDTLAQEARDLRDWLEREHPGLNLGTPKSIENSIRNDYRVLKAKGG